MLCCPGDRCNKLFKYQGSQCVNVVVTRDFNIFQVNYLFVQLLLHGTVKQWCQLNSFFILFITESKVLFELTLTSSTDLDGRLRVSIPLERPVHPVLGSKVLVPCYFQDNTVNDPGAPTVTPLLHRIKWTYITKEKIRTILVASEGKVHVETEYLDRVTMINYPLVSTDASIEITELRSKDSGTYRCEVIHGIEDNYDSVNIQVQGAPQKQSHYKNIAVVHQYMLFFSTEN